MIGFVEDAGADEDGGGGVGVGMGIDDEEGRECGA